jgi:hypothetical protein
MIKKAHRRSGRNSICEREIGSKLREGDAGNQNLNGSVEKIQKLLVQAF